MAEKERDGRDRVLMIWSLLEEIRESIILTIRDLQLHQKPRLALAFH